jgi:hypothetical protein
MFATQEKSIQITAPLTETQEFILNEEALRFLSKLAQAFEPRRPPTARGQTRTPAGNRRRSHAGISTVHGEHPE